MIGPLGDPRELVERLLLVLPEDVHDISVQSGTAGRRGLPDAGGVQCTRKGVIDDNLSQRGRRNGGGVGQGGSAGGMVGRGAALAAAAARFPVTPAATRTGTDVVLAALLLAGPASTRTATAQTPDASSTTVPDLAAVAAFEGSSLAPVVDRFSADWGALQRKWADLPYSPAHQQRWATSSPEWRRRWTRFPSRPTMSKPA